MDFASDNTAGASSRVLDALVAANQGSATPYGADTWTARAKSLLCEVFERECEVSLVATGTGANALALGSLTPPWGAVLCHAEAHVMDSECGAPELFTGGAKLVGVAGSAAKMTPETLDAAMAPFTKGVMHQVQLASLSLSQATECGTVYGVEEIRALTGKAHAAGLGVHMDGARFANALVHLGCSPAEMTWKAGVDVVSFGATKNGAMACEAVVFFDPARAAAFAFQKKRSGHVLSKGRFLGAQMVGYLEGGHWLDLARGANAAASRLREGLGGVPGVHLPWPTEANEVFALIPPQVDRALKAAGVRYYPWSMAGLPAEETAAGREGEAPAFVRLICSFATEAGDVDRLLAIARAAV